jgi:hypothetical protein
MINTKRAPLAKRRTKIHKFRKVRRLRNIIHPRPTQKRFDQYVLELFLRLLMIFKTSSVPLSIYSTLGRGGVCFAAIPDLF